MHTLKDLKKLLRDCEKIEKDLMNKYEIDKDNESVIKKYNEITGAIDSAYNLIESKL